MRTAPRKLLPIMLLALGVWNACGGGGGGSSSTPTAPPTPPTLAITTGSPLPATLQGQAYSTTLAASGGSSPYHWSIAPISQTALFVNGLSIDQNTGVISGAANFLGTAGFVATVSDSASPPQTATKTFTITASTPLAVVPTQNVNAQEFNDIVPISLQYSGGVAPITYSFNHSCLPAGLKAGDGTVSAQAIIFGIPISTGTFQCQITVQDSFSPPEMGTQLITIVVKPPPLALAPYSLPTKLLLNRPFSGRVVTFGGVSPYSFAVTSGSLPAGMGSVDANTGQVSGTPSTLGFSTFTVKVIDSSSTPQSVSQGFGITVSQPLGRNDSPATATAIGNGSIPSID